MNTKGIFTCFRHQEEARPVVNEAPQSSPPKGTHHAAAARSLGFLIPAFVARSDAKVVIELARLSCV
jgi:hypothetical protein